jgi:hypothetical protein
MWREVTEPLPDGWYWWYSDLSDHKILRVVNGRIIDTRPTEDSYGFLRGELAVYEHSDFSGFWSGPLIPPVEQPVLAKAKKTGKPFSMISFPPHGQKFIGKKGK